MFLILYIYIYMMMPKDMIQFICAGIPVAIVVHFPKQY